MTYKIGMRNIKSAIAVFICIVIYQMFDFKDPFFAVIAALLTMESSIVNSFKMGKNRLMGTAMGAFIGLCFAMISPGNALLSTLGIIAIIYLCNILHWNKSITIAAVVFSSIMLNMEDVVLLTYSVSRIIDTSIGILIGLGVNFLIVPYNFEKSIQKQFELIKKDICKLIQESICSPIDDQENTTNLCTLQCCTKMQYTLVELHESLTHVKQELTEYSSQIKLKHVSEQRVKDVIVTLEILKEIYAHLKVISPISVDRQLNINNFNKLISLHYKVNNGQSDLPNNLDNIYNYHLSIVLENIELLEFPLRSSI